MTANLPMEPTPATAAAAAGASPAAGSGYAWNPAILGGREADTSGYGIRPSAARDRARLVRAAVRTDGKRLRRPLLLLIVGGLAGIAGWLAVSFLTAKSILEVEAWPGPYGLETGLGIVAYVAGVIVFSWGWELGIAGRAIRLSVLLLVAGVFIWLIVAVVAFIIVAIIKSDGDINIGGLGKGGDGAGVAAGGSGEGGLLGGIGRTVNDAVDSFTGDDFGDGGGDEADSGETAASGPAPCLRCGTLVDPATMRLCPSCGSPAPG